MRSKVAAAEMASEAGIPAVICNGTKEGTLLSASAGEPCGTRFAAGEGKASAYKLWLKYAKKIVGEIWVDQGAAKKLRSSGSSLLPVGVVEVRGAFNPGDAVAVVEADGKRLIGKGVTQYSEFELRQVKGLQSSEVRDRLASAPDEVVHRDRFVLL
jgi:glutamate 5-kinase